MILEILTFIALWIGLCLAYFLGCLLYLYWLDFKGYIHSLRHKK